MGLAITQVMAMTGMIQWGMRQSAEVTNQMMSVERVLEYTELAPEPNLRDSTVDGRNSNKRKKRKSKKRKSEHQEVALFETPENWPSDGRVEFKAVYMRYSEEDPPVLKGLSLVIRPSEKVCGFLFSRRLSIHGYLLCPKKQSLLSKRCCNVACATKQLCRMQRSNVVTTLKCPLSREEVRSYLCNLGFIHEILWKRRMIM